MRFIKYGFWLTFWTVLLGFLHYTLPQKDIVRITGTEIIRADFSGANRIFYAQGDHGNDATVANRDLRLINTLRSGGREMVYRNEDTGFGWPPYFKLDSANLQAQAQDAQSTRAAPEWYAITHYGWRSEFLTIYPNGISLRPVEGPDVRIIPWFNIVFLTLLAALFWAIWVRWRRFRIARIDPVLEDAEEAWDRADARVDETRGKFRRWLDSFRSR